MWRRVDEYLKELGFGTSAENSNSSPTSGGLPEFIPENIFYRLAMKARNEVAEAFQAKVADEIIPAIRRTGYYKADSITDADLVAAIIERVEDKDRLPVVIEALRKADIDQGALIAEYVGIEQDKLGKGKYLANVIGDNSFGKEWIARYRRAGEKVYTAEDVAEWLVEFKCAEDGYARSVAECIIGKVKREQKYCNFTDYCGVTYFSLFGYFAVIDKMVKQGICKEEQAEDWKCCLKHEGEWAK